MWPEASNLLGPAARLRELAGPHRGRILLGHVHPLISRLEGAELSEHKSLNAGDVVELAWETPGQDGFAYTAVAVRRHR